MSRSKTPFFSGKFNGPLGTYLCLNGIDSTEAIKAREVIEIEVTDEASPN